MLVGVDVAVSVAVAVGVAVAVAVGVGVALGVAVGVATGPLPVPLRLTLCGLAASPTALTPSVALSAPTMLGVNFSVYVQCAAPASVASAGPARHREVGEVGAADALAQRNRRAAVVVTVTVLFSRRMPVRDGAESDARRNHSEGRHSGPAEGDAAGPPLGSCGTEIENVPLSAVSMLGVNVTA